MHLLCLKCSLMSGRCIQARTGCEKFLARTSFNSHQPTKQVYLPFPISATTDYRRLTTGTKNLLAHESARDFFYAALSSWFRAAYPPLTFCIKVCASDFDSQVPVGCLRQRTKVPCNSIFSYYRTLPYIVVNITVDEWEKPAAFWPRWSGCNYNLFNFCYYTCVKRSVIVWIVFRIQYAVK